MDLFANSKAASDRRSSGDRHSRLNLPFSVVASGTRTNVLHSRMGLLQALGEIVHGARDAGASFLVKRAVGHWLEPYGRMLSLSIDSKNSRIRVELLPKGEKEPIAI